MSDKLLNPTDLTKLGVELVKEVAGSLLGSSSGIMPSETPTKIEISLGDMKELKPNELLANRVTCQRRS